MTAKLSLAAYSVVLLAAMLPSPARAQWNSGRSVAPTTQPEIAMVESSYLHPGWLTEFCTVPKLLRMHCEVLPPEQGVLISRIERRGPAAMLYDLQVGDVLLSADGESVFGMASLPEFPGAKLTVMRAGEVISIEPRAACPPDTIVNQQPLPWAPAVPTGNGYGVSASAFASGHESVSVARNGDEITLEMSLPELQSAPIRFRGTREQITHEVQNSKLSPAARQRVLQAIR